MEKSEIISLVEKEANEYVKSCLGDQDMPDVVESIKDDFMAGATEAINVINEALEMTGTTDEVMKIIETTSLSYAKNVVDDWQNHLDAVECVATDYTNGASAVLSIMENK